jgi:hypothetical protein
VHQVPEQAQVAQVPLVELDLAQVALEQVVPVVEQDLALVQVELPQVLVLELEQDRVLVLVEQDRVLEPVADLVQVLQRLQDSNLTI